MQSISAVSSAPAAGNRLVMFFKPRTAALFAIPRWFLDVNEASDMGTPSGSQASAADSGCSVRSKLRECTHVCMNTDNALYVLFDLL